MFLFHIVISSCEPIHTTMQAYAKEVMALCVQK